MLVQLTWQDALAVAVTLWAVWYVARRIVGVVRRNRVTACGTCPGCPSSAARRQADKKPFVPSHALSQHAPRDRGARR
jgi:hypothetical protein